MFTGKTLPLSKILKSISLDAKLIRDCDITYVGKIPSRVEPRLVPCIKLEHIAEALTQTGITGIVTKPEFVSLVPNNLGLLASNNPIQSAYCIHEFLSQKKDFQWVSFPSRISKSAKIHPSAVIPEHDVIIGKNCTIHPNAVLYPRTIINEGSSIGAGSIIGCNGFEVDTSGTKYRILPQAGGVKIGKNVDIQAKCTIVRSTFGGFTEISDEAMFDCQVHLAHDCYVGKRVRITACSEVSGRVEIGDDAYLGPNISISNGIRIGKNSHITIGSVVTRDVASGARVSGNFAIEHEKWINLMRKIR